MVLLFLAMEWALNCTEKFLEFSQALHSLWLFSSNDSKFVVKFTFYCRFCALFSEQSLFCNFSFFARTNALVWFHVLVVCSLRLCGSSLIHAGFSHFCLQWRAISSVNLLAARKCSQNGKKSNVLR